MGTWQNVWIGFYGLSLLLAANRHGKPREGKENFFASLFGVALAFVIVYLGGFFK